MITVKNLKKIPNIKRIFQQKKVLSLLVFIFIFEILLISHRVGFYFNNLFALNNNNEALLNVMVRGSVLQQAQEIINENKLNEYSLDEPSLTKEIYYPYNNLLQRVIEINYPVIFKKKSKFMIAGISNKIEQCRIISKKNNLILYEC